MQQKESLGKSHVVKNVDGNANAEGTELLYNLTSLAHHGQWDDIVGKTKCLLYTVAGFISAMAKETSGVAENLKNNDSSLGGVGNVGQIFFIPNNAQHQSIEY